MMASGIPTPNPILAPVDNPESDFDPGVLDPVDIVGGGVVLIVCDAPDELVCEPVGLSLGVCVAAASTLLSVLCHQTGTPSPMTNLPFVNFPTVTLPGYQFSPTEYGIK
jgi:hypothetical protein